MAAPLSFRLSDIIPSEELSEMGRRRYQCPRVQKTRSKRPEWYVRVRLDVRRTEGERITVGRREERLYLGFCDEIGKREAEKRRDERLAEVVNKPQVSIPSQVKFLEVCKVYRKEHLSQLRETTRAMQECALSKHIEPTLGPKRLCDIDALAIQRWIVGMDLSFRTRQGYLSLLKIIWGKARLWGYTQQPFPAERGALTLGVNRPVKGHEMPTMDQLRRLLAVLEDPYRAMAEVALYSGLRISEIRGLQWGDIGAESVVIRRRMSEHGHIDVPKSQRGNRLLDVRPLLGVFARLPKAGDYIFASAGSYSLCLDVMRAARVTAGITVARFGWHHLRAIFNTLARSSGADSADRQALMGHATEAMNRAYIMQTEADVRRRGDLMLAVQGLVMGETKGVM